MPRKFSSQAETFGLSTIARPNLVLLPGGNTTPKDEEDTYCDWCGTDPGPSGDCDCPPVRNQKKTIKGV